MNISDLEFLLFLSQDFVSKEAQANNGDIRGEMCRAGSDFFMLDVTLYTNSVKQLQATVCFRPASWTNKLTLNR